MPSIRDLAPWLRRLAGQEIPLPENEKKLGEHDPFSRGGIGYSQFNELLLTLGYDRVTQAFFRYLFSKETGEPKTRIQLEEEFTVPDHRCPLSVDTFDDFKEGVDRFRKDALLLYGNIKFAFKTLSEYDPSMLTGVLEKLQAVNPKVYEARHDPLHQIKPITASDAYYLGYIVEAEIKAKLDKNPKDPDALCAQARIPDIRNVGRENHDAYLTYDHMDVYVATSMRHRHEFHMVHGFIHELFERPEVKELKLRFFDPTQAYCKERIDKGLVEGLMVKRSKCTIYHAQEADTLGKDSELATTLAQGKPVIAYVPRISDQEQFKAGAFDLRKLLYADLSGAEIIETLMPLYYPEFWKDKSLRGWVVPEETAPRLGEIQVFEMLIEKARAMYEKRAKTLKESHPLGLQVNLATGVTNGVLVVRSVEECARLLRDIFLNTMKFDVVEKEIEGQAYLLLIERITGCIYRVMSGDALLTNSFWNFYLTDGQVDPERI